MRDEMIAEILEEMAGLSEEQKEEFLCWLRLLKADPEAAHRELEELMAKTAG